MRPLILLAAALACAALPASAAELRGKLGAGSRLWLEGNSTLHAYSSSATALTAEFSFGSETAKSLDSAFLAKAPAKLSLRVPVKGLKSGSKGLDENLWKTMKADKHPEIRFDLEHWSPADAPGRVLAKGELGIAGEKVVETIEASVTAGPKGLTLDGQKVLKMSDFGVKAPVMMLGAIKTDDRVTVKFHLELEPAAEKKD